MSVMDLRAERYRDSGRNVKAARIAAVIRQQVVTYARDSGCDPTNEQAAVAALDLFDRNADYPEAWQLWASDAGYVKPPSDETKALVRSKLLKACRVPV